MTHAWCPMLAKLVENAGGTDLRGDPGDWDSALYQLIAEGYRVPRDADDTAIQAILIVLHEAIQGNLPLDDLAETCIGFARRRGR